MILSAYIAKQIHLNPLNCSLIEQFSSYFALRESNFSCFLLYERAKYITLHSEITILWKDCNNIFENFLQI